MPRKITYVGVFPPPYGGVTVKNELLVRSLATCAETSCEFQLDVINLFLCQKNPALILPSLFRLLRAWSGDTVLYGLDSKRLRLLTALQTPFSQSWKRAIMVGMGGRMEQWLLRNRRMREQAKRMKAVLVETEGIKWALEKDGFRNVAVFPNPKTGEGACPPRARRPDEPLKLVFFSQISREKGVYDVMEMTRILNAQAERISFSVDFYGHVAEASRAEFEGFVAETENVRYCGVFDSARDNVYRKLNEYDILLFPTHWKTEGVPGVLVEAKMAGLAAIASNHAYNAEIVREKNLEGIIIDGNYAEEMAARIKFLWEDPECLSRLKEGSFRSRERYALENYSELLRALLFGGTL